MGPCQVLNQGTWLQLDWQRSDIEVNFANDTFRRVDANFTGNSLDFANSGFSLENPEQLTSEESSVLPGEADGNDESHAAAACL